MSRRRCNRPLRVANTPGHEAGESSESSRGAESPTSASIERWPASAGVSPSVAVAPLSRRCTLGAARPFPLRRSVIGRSWKGGGASVRGLAPLAHGAGSIDKTCQSSRGYGFPTVACNRGYRLPCPRAFGETQPAALQQQLWHSECHLHEMARVARPRPDHAGLRSPHSLPGDRPSHWHEHARPWTCCAPPPNLISGETHSGELLERGGCGGGFAGATPRESGLGPALAPE